MKKIFFVLTILVFFGCETEEQKKQKAQEVVQALISNIQVDNYESIYEYYPSFKNWTGSYYKYNSVEITSTMLKDDGTIEIFANAGGNNQLFFALEKVNGNYKTISSKGLSAYFNSDLYQYCKKIGCIGNNETDIDIGRICKSKEDEFKSLVSSIQYKIESKTKLESNALEIKNGGFGNYYAFGNITVKNYSRFALPAYSYKLYINFLDINDKVLFRKEIMNNYDDIGYGQSKTLHAMQDISSKFRKVDISLKLLNTEFIDKLIAEYAEGSFCIYSDNL